MTCKNCVYEPRCHSRIAYGMDTDDLTGRLLTDIEKGCNHFKDKADYVSVVRCKDCKHCIDEGMSGLWCNHADNRNPIGCRPDDYCNDGERKDYESNMP